MADLASEIRESQSFGISEAAQYGRDKIHRCCDTQKRKYSAYDVEGGRGVKNWSRGRELGIVLFSR